MEICIYYRPDNRDLRQIRMAINIINQLQNQYKIIDKSDECADLHIPVSFSTGSCDDLGGFDSSEYKILITSDPFDDNWFSHEGHNFSVITTDSWSSHFAPPSVKAYLLYQIAQALLTFSADMIEEVFLSQMAHEETIGCVNDMCMYKKDIRIGISAGYICPSCRTTYLQYGVSEARLQAVEAVLAAARSEAIAKPISFLPVADEKRIFIVHGHNEACLKMLEAYLREIGLTPVILKKLARNGIDNILNQISENTNVMCAILLFTADDKGRALTEKSFRKRARQNVVFEAGYFIGKLGKEKVLMMSEKDIELPSDLGGCRYIEIDENAYWKAALYEDLKLMGLDPIQLH